jgi:catechol 2,3-dioxygenase-like lactoylglutathione lyase family enzyme
VPLASSNLVAFVSAIDAARAREFYRDVLGLRLVHESPLALEFDANGTMLRVTIVRRVDPAAYTVLGWAVADIAKAVDALSSRGVRFLRYEGINQDERGIWLSPGGGRIAWFADPEGNTLSLTQFRGE